MPLEEILVGQEGGREQRVDERGLPKSGFT